jgi:hypothetical protein
MKKLGMAVMAGLVLTAGVVFTASKSDGDVLREVRDRQEIEDLTWRYITAIVAGGANTPLRVAGVGRSVDDLVRLNGQWLIKSRNVAPQD